MRSQLKGSVAVLALLSAPVWAQDAPAEAAAGMTAEMCAPVVTVTQTPPEVRITMGDDPEGDPQVVVIQSPPTVEVEQCPPVFSGIEGDIAITEAEPEIVVNAAESAELVVTRRSDAAAGEAAEAEATEPEAAEAEAAEPEMTEAEAAEPEAAADAPAEAEGQSDEMPAEAEETQPPATTLNTEADEQPDADAGAAETDAPEADAPETDAPEADAAEAGASDTGAAETEVMDTEAPEAEGAQTEMPEADTAEIGAAEADAAEAEAAEAEAPDADADTPADDTPAPEAATQDPTPAEAGAEPGQAVLREGNSAISAEEAMTADLEGVPVITSDDETAGEIAAVDAQAGQVILSVGGLLGMGQRDVAVPLDQLSFQRDADGELQVYLPFPSDEVEDLPDYEAAE